MVLIDSLSIAQLLPAGGPSFSYPDIDEFDTMRWMYLASSISGSAVANEGTESGFDLKTANSSAYDDPTPPDVFALPVNETLSAAATIAMRFESLNPVVDPVITNGFTISGWVKLQGPTSANDYIIAKQNNELFTGTPGIPVALIGNSNDTVSAYVNFGGPTTTLLVSSTNDTALQDHAWSHIGLTINAANDTFNLYVNGRLHATSALVAVPDWGASGPWMLSGHTTTTADGFNGQLFDFRVAEIERDEAWFLTMWTARHLLNSGI